MGNWRLRLGWWLMGYPAAVYWQCNNGWLIEVETVPGWERVYRLGARLANW